MLTEVVRKQLRRLPSPGGRTLTDDDLDDAVQDFVAERWERTVATLLTEATNDESVVKLLHTIVRNWRIDKFRATDRGSVRRRLDGHLAATSEFEQVLVDQPGAGRWRLVGSTGAPWGGRLEDLVAAAWTVRAAAVRWTDPNRRPPIASVGDLTAVLQAVMVAAGGQSLEVQQLVEVIMRRFPATLDPQWRSLEVDFDLPGSQLPPEEAWQTEQDAVTRGTVAAHIFNQLTPAERAVLPLMDSVVAVQQHLCRGRSTAYTYIGKLKDHLLELAGGYDDAEQVVLEVIDRCVRSGQEGGYGSSSPGALDNLAHGSSDAGVIPPSTAGGTS